MALVINGTNISKVICNATTLSKVICNGVTVYTSTKDLGWSAGGSHRITEAENAAGSITKTYQTGQADLTDYSTLTVTYKGLHKKHSDYSYYYSTFQLISSSGSVAASWSGNNPLTNDTSATRTINISSLSGNYYIKITCTGRGAGNYTSGYVTSAIATA